MCRIAVIILHYENLQDTLECINSLNTQDEKNFDIVVVDNGSKNGKTESVEHLFSDNERIHFLYSKTNLGFAKGNNLGFCYAKEELHSDIIVLANNDLIFSQPDFITKVQKAYIEEGYDVAGPRIISLVDGMNQNPVARMFYSKRDVLKRYLKSSMTRAIFTKALMRDFTVLHVSLSGLHPSCFLKRFLQNRYRNFNMIVRKIFNCTVHV